MNLYLNTHVYVLSILVLYSSVFELDIASYWFIYAPTILASTVMLLLAYNNVVRDPS